MIHSVARRRLPALVLALAVTASACLVGQVALAVPASAAACAPTVTTDGDATVLTFTVVGTCTWTVPVGVSNLDAVLIVGGGGGGGMDQGGGGGAGGVADRTNVTVTPGADLAVVVGGGGAGGTPYPRDPAINNGGDSSFNGVVALGGGYGGNGGGNGGSGGSGGGAGYSHDAVTKQGGSALQPGSAAGGLGTAGGDSIVDPSGGGGGGAGGIGGVATSNGGSGGAGVARTITGSLQYYAGGGGGNSGGTVAVGGSGVGGSGGLGTTNATNGVANTGSGGGGGATGFRFGGSGGSGIVIIRHGAPSPVIAVQTPPSWMQSVGRLSERQTCDAGWAPSWAQWMNDRLGGWVCNREIYWDWAIAGWSQR